MHLSGSLVAPGFRKLGWEAEEDPQKIAKFFFCSLLEGIADMLGIIN